MGADTPCILIFDGCHVHTRRMFIEIHCDSLGLPCGHKQRHLFDVNRDPIPPPTPLPGAYSRHQFRVHDKSFDAFSTSKILRYHKQTCRLPDNQPMDSVIIVHEDGVINGCEIQQAIREKYPMMPIVMVSFHGTSTLELRPCAYMDEHTKMFNLNFTGDREQLFAPFIYIAETLNKQFIISYRDGS